MTESPKIEEPLNGAPSRGKLLVAYIQWRSSSMLGDSLHIIVEVDQKKFSVASMDDEHVYCFPYFILIADEFAAMAQRIARGNLPRDLAHFLFFDRPPPYFFYGEIWLLTLGVSEALQ